MLHAAASRMRCASVSAGCYRTTIPEQPRPCPAKVKGKCGCDCDTLKCATHCKYATPRDGEARFVWYSGSNQRKHLPNQNADKASDQKKGRQGKGCYGYRSLPLRVADQRRRFSLTLLSDVLPANVTNEDRPGAALLMQLPHYYPDLQVDAVAGDANFGKDLFLSLTYNLLHARRVVDLRSHAIDEDKTNWLLRGYDDKGRPICHFGYAFRANGFDRHRQRYKWVCARVCLKGSQPRVQLSEVIYPPPECPYQDDQHPHGRVFNLAERFPDGSIRLVRDVPFGSSTWKALYHRGRNAVEGRNATFEDWNLKRLPVYGLPRSKAILFLADVWDNLTTLARLIREATQASLEPP